MSILSRTKRAISVLLNKEPKQNNNVRYNHFLTILLDKHGNRLSAEKQSSIDAFDNPIPWFTYPAIEYINQLDLTEFNILEWGCGNSTIYFSSRCKSITSIESNKEWFMKINPLKAENSSIYLKEDESSYKNFPLTLKNNFEVIIIDGIHRSGCVDTALNLHQKTGFIILDNSDRYPDLCRKIRNHDYLEIDFHGFGPINNYTWTTSFFFASKAINNIKPLNLQPLIPIGGGY